MSYHYYNQGVDPDDPKENHDNYPVDIEFTEHEENVYIHEKNATEGMPTQWKLRADASSWSPNVMLSKFIKDKNFPVINFDVTNDYFSDLSSECLKYFMFVENLGWLSTFVNQISEDVDITEELNTVEGWEVMFHYETDKSVMAFIKTDEGSFAEVVKAKNKVSFNVAADERFKLVEAQEVADKLFPVIKVSRHAETIPINFWSAGPSGPTARQKKINPLHWDRIAENYTEHTRKSIDDLIQVQPPIEGGKLILWHGAPGTGKSSAIRSLVHKWLPWCNTSYVVDPEAFFGNANYMLSVLLDKSSNDDYDYDDEGEEETDDGVIVLQHSKRWNLLIIEDADEFLQANAKDRTGQALSRLLNLSDGLIGQGLNFLVLITTNALLGEIHSAVQREGRCMSVNEFHKFNRGDAKLWLGPEHAELLNDDKAKKLDQLSLAQLYDLRRDRSQIKDIKEEVRTGVYI